MSHIAFRRLLPSVFNTQRFSTSALRLTTPTSPPLSEGEHAIRAKLTDRFSPSQLRVQDVSGGCGTFYAITIASKAFQGLSIVKQHQLVTDTLKREIEGIHGLQIKTIFEGHTP
jgi:stress-induced morphogen